MAAPGDPRARQTAAPLVGRDRELAMLREALATALAGRGSLVLIAGEAGIGKTALAERLLAEAEGQGALALVGRCYDLTETPPYGPWAETLARTPQGDAHPSPPDVAGGASAASQAALFALVREHLAALAGRRPLVLLLDDLHWADPASLDLLRFLARQLADMPVLLVATYRAEEVAEGHPLAALLPLLVREARAARLDLRPLGAAALEALVARYALPAGERARLVGWLQGRAEGNPLYTGELLRTLEGEGLLGADRAGDGAPLGDLAAVPVPTLLRQVIAGRGARLGEDARRLLAIAATIGQEVPLDLWAMVARADEGSVLDAAERAVAAHLLVETPDGAAVRFAHALVREALYEATPAPRRRAWHRATAEALGATPAPDPDAVASHFQRAADPRAVAWLVRAAERAERAYAWRSAAERLAAAAALLAGDAVRAAERARLLLRLGFLRRYTDPASSVAHADEALRLAEAAGDRALAAEALAARGIFRIMTLDFGRGLADLAAGVAAQEALGVPAPLRGALILNLANVGRFAEAAALGEARPAGAAARAGAGGSIGSDTGNGWNGLGKALAFLGDPEGAARALERALADYRAAAHHPLYAAVTIMALRLVALAYHPERLAERRRLAGEAVDAAGRTGDAGLDAPPAAAALPVLVLEGRWSEAHALALAGHAGGFRAFPILGTQLFLGPLARARGEADLAREAVRTLLPAGLGTEPGEVIYDVAVAAQLLAAALATDAGDLPAARAWLAAHDRWLDWAEAVLGRAEGALGWAAYHRAAGDLEAARARGEQALAHASDPRQPLALLAAHRLMGELETVEGRHAAAQAHLDAALALADACAAPYERALTLLALAELRAAESKPAEAGAALAEARGLLEPLAAEPALARAGALAAQLVGTPAPAAPSREALPFGLSAREAEVLRLVAQGLTNAQAAERLFVAPRTINAHLTSIYGKLGVATRAAATRLAVEHGLA